MFVCAASLACGGVHLFLMGRWQQAAGARLRRPELRAAETLTRFLRKQGVRVRGRPSTG